MFNTKIRARAPFDTAGPLTLKTTPRRRSEKRGVAALSGIEDVELFLRSGGFSG